MKPTDVVTESPAFQAQVEKRTAPLLMACAIIGLALWWPSMRITSLRMYLGDLSVDSPGMVAFFLASLLCIALIAGGIAHKVVDSFGHVAFPVLGVSLSAVGMATLFGGMQPGIVGASLFAAYGVLVPMAWLVLIVERTEFTERQALVLLLSSFVLSYVPGLASGLGGESSPYMLPALGPAVSCLLLFACMRLAPLTSIGPTQGRSLQVVRPSLPNTGLPIPLIPSLIALSLLCCIPSGLLQISSEHSLVPSGFTQLNGIFLLAATLLLLITAIVRQPFVRDASLVLFSSSAFFVGNIVLVALGLESSALQVSLLGPCKACFTALLFCLIATRLLSARNPDSPSTTVGGADPGRADRGEAAAQDTSMSAALVFALTVFACNILGLYIVPSLARAMGYRSYVEDTTLPLIFALAIALCVILLLISAVRCLLTGVDQTAFAGQALTSGQAIASRLEDDATKPLASPAASAGRLAQAYGLTDRERDTLALILAGNTFKRVSETQDISLSTVQSRMKSIYRKLDIHSKQELVDLASASGADGAGTVGYAGENEG